MTTLYVADGYVAPLYVQTGISIDWAAKIIYVPKMFLTWLGGTVYQLDTDAFRVALKDLEDSELGMCYPVTHNHNTAVLLGGIQYARVIEITNGYTITFENGSYVVNLVGSNNNILDMTNLNLVQVRSNNSAGLINIRELQHGVFNNGVTVDQTNGIAGQTYPIGTPLQPVNNFADARVIALSRGFKTMFIRGDATIGTNDDVSDFLLIGENASRTYINIDSIAETAAVEIRDATLTGILDGGTIVRQCYIFDLSYVNGFLFQCELAGTIMLGGGFPAHIMNCFSEINETTIDFNGAGNSLNMQQSSGKYRFINKTGPDICSIHVTSGHLTFDSTITDTTNICAAGIGAVTDNTATGVQCDAMVSSSSITTAIFSQSQVTPIEANVTHINNGLVVGDGSEQDPWRKQGVQP